MSWRPWSLSWGSGGARWDESPCDTGGLTGPCFYPTAATNVIDCVSCPTVWWEASSVRPVRSCCHPLRPTRRGLEGEGTGDGRWVAGGLREASRFGLSCTVSGHRTEQLFEPLGHLGPSCHPIAPREEGRIAWFERRLPPPCEALRSKRDGQRLAAGWHGPNPRLLPPRGTGASPALRGWGARARTCRADVRGSRPAHHVQSDGGAPSQSARSRSTCARPLPGTSSSWTLSISGPCRRRDAGPPASDDQRPCGRSAGHPSRCFLWPPAALT